MILTQENRSFDHVPPPTAPEGTPGAWITVNPLPPETGGIAGPIGLGLRVPMLVVSPWSTGGWVSSETFDHTSTLRLPARHNRFPAVPDPAAEYQRELTEVATLPAPVPPTTQTVPHQEPGHRPHTF
jgi:phospholipase C